MEPIKPEASFWATSGSTRWYFGIFIHVVIHIVFEVGVANQKAPACDLQVNNAIRNKLFKNADKEKSRPGDLAARNIQRGRDHGIPGYEKLRQACGMADIVGMAAPAEINADDWRKLMKTYKNDPSQMDGFTAGLAETAPADGMVSF